MKMVTNVCDGGGTVELDPERPAITIPPGYQKHSMRASSSRSPYSSNMK